MDLRLKLWLEKDGKMVFGDGLCQLLSGIDRLGSIAAAAAGMGLAYREAWGRLRQAEEGLGEPLLARKAGGAEGGGAALTARGRSLLETFTRLKDGLTAEAARLAQVHLAETPPGSA